MPTRIARYAFLNARVSMLATRLLPEGGLIPFLDAPLGEQKTLLAKVGITQVDPEAIERADAVDLIVAQQLLDDITQLVRPLSGPARELVMYWAHRFELANLKTLLRGRFHGEDPESIKQQLMDLGEYQTLKVDALLAAEDVAELLRQLESHGHYADIARQARQVYEERHDLFTLEASVDRQYFAGLSAVAARFRGAGAKQLHELVADVIDRINLIWLLRYRFAYGLPPAEAYYLLVPAGGRLTRSRLLTLVELDGWEQVQGQLPEPLKTWVQDARSTGEVHRLAKTHALDRARQILEGTSFNFARAFAYLLLREWDLRRIAAILKGKVLRLSPEAIEVAADLQSTGPASTEVAAA